MGSVLPNPELLSYSHCQRWWQTNVAAHAVWTRSCNSTNGNQQGCSSSHPPQSTLLGHCLASLTNGRQIAPPVLLNFREGLLYKSLRLRLPPSREQHNSNNNSENLPDTGRAGAGGECIDKPGASRTASAGGKALHSYSGDRTLCLSKRNVVFLPVE